MKKCAAVRVVVCQLAVLLLAGALFAPVAVAGHNSQQTLQGTVTSAGAGLAGYQVSLYGSFIQSGSPWQLLGSSTTDSSGHFSISYIVDGSWNQNQPVLFVEATHGQAMLASVIGIGLNVPSSVVVNELTTVATANAYAQFIGSAGIQGNFVGMKNAILMAANLADPVSGNAGVVISSTPNGTETSTYATFNSLANLVAGCVANSDNCAQLISATTPAQQTPPANVLQALANLVNDPSYPGYPFNNQDPIFLLSQADPVFTPALSNRPTSWLLFLKITGGFYSQQDDTNLMNGPGAFAVDSQGYVWADNNYIPEPPGHFACAGTRVLKFTPSGASAPGSPYFGGGISGSGWGIFIDTSDNVWVPNFGFEDPPCQFMSGAAPHNSISEFSSNGIAISPTQGFTEGNMSWPMGGALDRTGNIWIANCGNDTVTRYGNGDPAQASSIALGSAISPNNPQIKPFGVAVDGLGNIWITNNRASTVTILSPNGKVIKTVPGTYQGKTIITHPIGNATDIEGNMWVANSDYLDAPCPTKNMRGPAKNPSVSLFNASTQLPDSRSPFTGGGVVLPWGLLIDGKDTVWVFNFGIVPIAHQPPTALAATSVSRFCGEEPAKCPANFHTGDPISPNTGYQSDAFMRITGGAVDPSGNLWMTDNWKLDANPFLNPGGNAIVIAIGAAGPVETPIIGPPVPAQ